MLARGTLSLYGLILTPDGTVAHEDRASGRPEDAIAIGHGLGERLRAAGGPDFFHAVAG